MTRTRLGVALFASVLALIPIDPAPGSTANPSSQWKPGCGIDGRPIEVHYFFCNDGYFDGQFRGAPNHEFFSDAAGAYFNVAIYDGSGGAHLWGPLGDTYSDFEELGPTQVSGSGPREDPFEHRAGFGAGDPRELYVRPYTRYVNGRNTFETWWDVQNVSDEPLNFRATIYANVGIHGQCAYGDLQTNPRALGSFSPREGVPYEPNDCYAHEGFRGFSGYAVEHEGSEWSAYQQGDEYDVKGRIQDPTGPGLANTFDPRPVPEALAIQWDRHGKGRSPLPPGETATFRLGWRFTSDLLVEPFYPETNKSTQRLKLSTRHAADGPIVGQAIAYEISRKHVSGGGVLRGVVTTNRRGIAWLRWKEGVAHYDSIYVGFDADGDGRLQRETELYRGPISAWWRKRSEHERTRLSLERTANGFRGRVRAIHQKDPDFGRDCRKYRTIAIRRRAEGRDHTLASAASGERGFWDLEVDAPAGRYYAVVLSEVRSQGNMLGYICRAARAD